MSVDVLIQILLFYRKSGDVLMPFYLKRIIWTRTSSDFPSERRLWIIISTDFGSEHIVTLHTKRRLWIRTSTDFPSEREELGSSYLLALHLLIYKRRIWIRTSTESPSEKKTLDQNIYCLYIKKKNLY